MAYDKKKLAALAIKEIKEHNLFYADDVFAFLPCSKATFYNHKLEQLDDIKNLLEQNRIKTKTSLKAKWYKSENATLQLALFKLLSDDSERRALAMEYHEHSGSIDLITHEGDSKL